MEEGRSIRNIIAGLMLLALTFGSCFYFGAAIYILFIGGVGALDFNSLNPSLSDFPYRLWPTIFDYIAHWWVNIDYYDSLTSMKLFFSLLSPFGIVGVIFWNIRKYLLKWRPFKQKESLHGDAKWADEKEIRKAGLRSKAGLLLGRDDKGFLIASGYQHALLFAPTGSGKGVGFVIPNLLFWEDSVIIHDIKLENYELTSGWRQKHLKQEVFCWSPANPEGISHCYNPIDWVSEKPGQMVDDVQKIANLLMPEQDFWVNEARSLFLGIVLYLLAVPDKIKSFGEVVRTMRSDDVVYNLAVVLDTMGKQIHPVGYMNIAAFLQKAEKERSGVISHMNSSLELWANPLIDTATATSDFNFMEFKKKKTTVYVGLTPDNLKRMEPLMQVFYQQATEFLCRHLPRDDEPYGVLFMMDEFPSLGKMEQFQTGIAYFRGYNVRLFLIIQDTEQLKGIYEEAGMNSFLSNSTYRITFAANNIDTANLISQLIGNKTVKQESLNRPKFMDLNPGARSLHISDTQRALLLPQEVIMLPRDEQILLIESTAPIKSKKIKFFEDKSFTKKIIDPIFIPTQEPFDPQKFAEAKKLERKQKELEENKAPEIDNVDSDADDVLDEDVSLKESDKETDDISDYVQKDKEKVFAEEDDTEEDDSDFDEDDDTEEDDSDFDEDDDTEEDDSDFDEDDDTEEDDSDFDEDDDTEEEDDDAFDDVDDTEEDELDQEKDTYKEK